MSQPEKAWKNPSAFSGSQYCTSRPVPKMRRLLAATAIGTAEQGLSAYMATKMGAIGFMRGLANDVAAYGITCNAILPSLTNTPATAGVPDEAKKFVWQQQAIKRLAEPEDIVGPVAFLASEEASFITGQALVVDGGLVAVNNLFGQLGAAPAPATYSGPSFERRQG